jgi:hypothetical protein
MVLVLRLLLSNDRLCSRVYDAKHPQLLPTNLQGSVGHTQPL